MHLSGFFRCAEEIPGGPRIVGAGGSDVRVGVHRGMPPVVEPIHGPELDRVVTALLNLTGVVHRVVDDEIVSGPLGADGIEVIGRVAARLRSMLVLFEEHHTDSELAGITELLAIATMLVAEQGGWDDAFHPDADMPL